MLDGMDPPIRVRGFDMKHYSKMNKGELLVALTKPEQFFSAEDHLEAFKRFKNMRAK